MAKPKSKRSLPFRVLRFIILCHLWFWGIIAALSLLYNFVNPPVTPLMIQRYIIRGYPIYKREYVALKQIPERTQNMLITVEDGNFYRHFGFDWEMIRMARERNRKAGKIRFGASTISNQLARTLFLTTDRNYLRKYLEIQATVIMEVLMSKKRMLELYFNYVEWGKGVYGIQTACLAYYGKSAAKLNREQSLRLLSILSNPVRYTPHTYASSASARERYQLMNRYH